MFHSFLSAFRSQRSAGSNGHSVDKLEVDSLEMSGKSRSKRVPDPYSTNSTWTPLSDGESERYINV